MNKDNVPARKAVISKPCQSPQKQNAQNFRVRIYAIPELAQRAGSSLVALIHNNERLPTSLRNVLALRR